jgi:hypothetical protein
MIEQSATLVVARRRWNQLVGRYGATTIPSRPNEGDLIYFPLTGGLFELKFVAKLFSIFGMTLFYLSIIKFWSFSFYRNILQEMR